MNTFKNMKVKNLMQIDTKSMKFINLKRNLRHLAIVIFLLATVFYLPVSGQIVTNFLNQIQAKRMYDEGLRLFNLGTEEAYTEAVPKFKEAASLYLTVNFRKEAGISILSAGNVSSLLGKKAEALELYNKALNIFEEIADIKRKAKALNNIGLIYYDLGDKEKCLDYYKKSLDLNNQINDKKGQVTALSNIGIIYSDKGSYQEALRYFNSALSLFNNGFESKGEESALLNNIGTIYYFEGQNQEALEVFNRALSLAQEVNDKKEEAQILTNIGAVYSHRGNKQAALNYYLQSLDLREKIGDKKGKSLTLSNIGVLYSETGDKRKALTYHNLALSTFRELKNKSGEAVALSNFGIIYAELWEKKKALEAYNESLKLFREATDKNGELITLQNIGGAYFLFGEHETALEYYNSALSIAKLINNKNSEATALHNIGTAYIKLGRYQDSLEKLNSALELRKAIKDKYGESSTLANIGLSFDLSGKKQEALKYYNQALLLSKLMKYQDLEAQTLANLMVIWDSLNHYRLAAFYGQMAIDKFESLREFTNSPIIDVASQKLFLQRIKPNYLFLIELLIKSEQFSKAIQILNFYQDQQSFDFYRDIDFTVRQVVRSPREQEFSTLYKTNTNIIEQLTSQTEKINSETDKLNLTNSEKTNQQKLEIDLKSATDNFFSNLERVKEELSLQPNEKDKVPTVPDVTVMQSVLRHLNSSTKQQTAALYTLIGEKKFYVLLITAEGNIKVFESPIDRQDFNDKLIQFYALLQRPAYDPRILGEELYKIIIPQKLEAELKKQNIQTLMWQLDGNLRYIPVAALWDGETYMVEKYQNVVLTRADSQRLLKETKPQWFGIGFGTDEEQQIDLLNDGNKNFFPGLSGVRKELENIFITNVKDKGILIGEVYENKDFTKEKFYEAMKKRPQVVHISSHYRFYAGDSTLSFLVLGNGKALTLNEMKDERGLFEGTDLLTLSACETGAVLPNADGREIDGFAELAQRLGANSVMASLWQVPEYSTSELMTKFYSNKLKSKLNKAESLRLAQLSLIKGNFQDKTKAGNSEKLKGEGAENNKYFKIYSKIDKKYRPPFEAPPEKLYSHPYFWSPFILFGNWK